MHIILIFIPSIDLYLHIYLCVCALTANREACNYPPVEDDTLFILLSGTMPMFFPIFLSYAHYLI